MNVHVYIIKVRQFLEEVICTKLHRLESQNLPLRHFSTSQTKPLQFVQHVIPRKFFSSGDWLLDLYCKNIPFTMAPSVAVTKREYKKYKNLTYKNTGNAINVLYILWHTYIYFVCTYMHTHIYTQIHTYNLEDNSRCWQN